jgi:hypothetical protein
MIMEHYWNDNGKEKPKFLEKTCRSVTFFTTKPTQTELGSNKALRVEDLMTDL